MLVRLTNSKGQEVWINPIHVKLVEQRRGVTVVVLGPGATTAGASALKVREPIDLVADLLNAGMPDTAYVPEDAPPAPSGGATIIAGLS